MKTRVTLKVDRAVLDWFRASGSGWNTRINAVFREWHKVHKGQPANGLVHMVPVLAELKAIAAAD